MKQVRERLDGGRGKEGVKKEELQKAKKDWGNLTPQEQEQKKLEALDNFKKSDKLKENIKEAEEMRDKSRLERYKWMYNNFKTGDKYDTKHGDPDKEHAGNFNYGAMGRAAGLSDLELKFGAGFQQWRDNTSSLSFWNSYGDDPVDQQHIQDGINWYDSNYEM